MNIAEVRQYLKAVDDVGTYEVRMEIYDDYDQMIYTKDLTYTNSHAVYCGYKSIMFIVGLLPRHGFLTFDLCTNVRPIASELKGGFNKNTSLVMALKNRMEVNKVHCESVNLID
ncbi:hypothetical protein [Fictibacillus terranigra]|uniref:Uncharacterized protein n=1 Tax=Fictibacillus terranigra TaxID=3058424 RepID=A0ABT8E6W5_9BACL|nr:hypothetical protein [Fictibacillus sp. CENA-BCM004]MDN4073629.1 hypothetical protein [Fictibacillus sp. CENA-BCM004]